MARVQFATALINTARHEMHIDDRKQLQFAHRGQYSSYTIHHEVDKSYGSRANP